MYVSSLWSHRSTKLRGNPVEMLCDHAGAKERIFIMHGWPIAASALRLDPAWYPQTLLVCD